MTTPYNDGQIEVIAATTSAKTSEPYTSKYYQWFVASADHLAGSETVNILVRVGTVLTQVLMPDLTTPAVLNVAHPGLPLIGGMTYVFDKSSTASACAVYIDPLTQ